MNILLYVISIIMLLTALTYSRLELFRSVVGLQAGYVYYIEATEHDVDREAAEKWYDIIHVQRQKSAEKNDKEREKAKGTSRLSLYPILNKQIRAQSPDAYAQTKNLFKQLMIQLYSEQPFFKESAAKNPRFLDELINEIETAIEQLPEDIKLSDSSELSRLKLAKEELHYAFFLMLEGLPSLKFTESKIISHVESKQNDTDQEEDAALEAEEAKSKSGYVSLVDMITVRKSSHVRIYLASPQLLKAIYEDDNIVQQIREKRYEFYRMLDKGAEASILSKEFYENYALQGHASEYNAILDFTVTKTNPHTYEK